WSWSQLAEESVSGTVTITATNADNTVATTIFTLTSTDVAPTVTETSTAVSTAENVTATNSGSFGDYDDAVTLSASQGTVTHNTPFRSWSWSQLAEESASGTVTITATNADNTVA